MQRDMLRTDAGAFAAVGAAGDDVEGPDDVEHIFLKRIGDGLVLKARIVVVEHALFARARGTHVAARVAADAARQLAAPEGVALLGCHGFELLNLVEPAAVHVFLALLAKQLVIADDLFTLAGLALEQQRIGLFDRFLAVDRGNAKSFAILRHCCDTGKALLLDGLHVAHPSALYADGVDRLAQDAVLL